MTEAERQRMEALERLLIEARGLARWPDAITDGGAVVSARTLYRVQAAVDALDALDALPAPAPERTVEVDIRAVYLQAINDKLDAVPKPRSYEMAHYCMGLEDAAMAIRSKVTVTPPLAEGGE